MATKRKAPEAENKDDPLKDIDEWQDMKKIAKVGEDLEEKTAQLIDEAAKKKAAFRNYVDSAQQERVSNFYRLQHTNQTWDYVQGKLNQYLPLDKMEAGLWEVLEELNKLVDDSDPDTDLSQLQHALQTAEAIRAEFPGEDFQWFQVVGLIHDLGKILSVKWGEPQWAAVGDTFPVGCAFDPANVFFEEFQKNADKNHPVYSTKNGVYEPGCGLDKVTMCWGHDEYLYRVCVGNNCKLPEEALYMIRYHSFYPWHKGGGYSHLLNEKDNKMLKWVREFNRFDLYSKAHKAYDPEELIKYYKAAILRFFPEKLKW